MAGLVFKSIAVIIVFYALFPTILVRFCHAGVIWRIPPGRGQVVLTFDDGPDPRYTPQVLDVLRQYGAKACFFVLGHKAEAHPELIKRIMDEGHEIGIHGYKHEFGWFLGPLGTYREIQKSSRIIKEISGRTSRFYRPTWGVLNIFSLFPYFLSGHRVVLWSFMSQDWGKRTQEKITRFVLKRIGDGSVMIFHDSDTAFGHASGAPLKMLAALPVILSEVQKKKLKVVSIAEIQDLSPSHQPLHLGRRLWNIWERLFEKMAGIEDPFGQESIFRLAVKRYSGPQRVMSDGTQLKKGDLIGELHLKNKMISEMSLGVRPEKVARIFLRTTLNALPLFAAEMKANSRYMDVKALFGVTLLHRGADKIGFNIYDLSLPMKVMTLLYEGWLLMLYHQNGFNHLRRSWRKLTPKLLIISRSELLSRYAGRVENPLSGTVPENLE